MSIDLSPEMEAAVLKESEDALRELVIAFGNVGLPRAQIALMLRSIADEIDAPSVMIRVPAIH